MNELEYELRELFQAQVDEAERPVDLLTGARRRASQSVRRRVGAGALAGVAAIAAVVLPIVARQPAANSPGAVISGSHTEPRGWVPVDYGKAQVWVPSAWSVGFYTCIESKAQGVVYVGATPDANCGTPPNVLTLAGPRLSGPTRIVKINGLSAKVKSANGSLSVYVPDLGNLQLTARGPLAIRALGTLRPSPLATALSGSPQAALPTGFRWHEFGGIKFAAPANWVSRHGTVSATCSSPSIAPDTVVLSTTPPISGLLCASYAPVPAGYLGGAQGVVVIAAPLAPPPPARKCVRSYREMRLFCAQPPGGLGTVYTLYLQPAGQKKATVMYIGVGSRGRFAREIIDSIRPASGR